jgi:thiol-disulfide isomerase/thioredoxin
VIDPVRKSALAIRRLFVLALILAGSAQAASTDALFSAKLVSSEGKPIALESFRGKPLIVNFWARWCAPCRVEIPELIKTQEKYGKRGLTVIGIGLEDKAESVRDFMKAYEMSYTVLLAKSGGIELMQALGNTRAGLPFTVAIGPNGNIVASKLGAMNRAELDAAAEAALK